MRTRRAPRPGRARNAIAGWAAGGGDFPVRRAAALAVTVLILVGLVAATTLAARADPGGGGAGGFSAVDIADSKGIRVSQYELSIGMGNILTSPSSVWLSMRLGMVWDLYRYGIALVAYVYDWTLGMSWLDALTAPIDAAARRLRDQVIGPIGLVSLMLLVSAAVGGVRIMYGRTGRGVWDIVSAAIVAAAVAALLVSPVARVAGEPLTKARNIGIAVAEVIDGRDPAGTDMAADPASTAMRPAPILIDAFVRPAHGLINYGVNFTPGERCTPAYDEALKAGPYWDPSAAEQREAVGDCDQRLGDYADKKSVYVASLGMGTFVVSGLLLGLTILVACVLLIVTVMMLAWSLLKLVVTGVIGIGPGDTRGPLIRNLFSVLASLVYVAVSTIVLALILVLIKAAFAADIPSPMGRFLLVDAMLIGGLVMVVQTWSAHRRGAESWAEKVMGKLSQSTPKPTVGSRVRKWLAAPAGGEAAKYGGLGGAVPGGAGPTTGGVRRMLRPFTASNAAALAVPGGKAAWWTARTAAKLTGYTAVGTAAGVARMGSGAFAGARWTADATHRVYDTYSAVRSGSRRATAGPRVDPWIHRAVRARSWLHAQTAAHSTAAALALGPRPTPPATAHTAAPAAGQHRPEEPARTTRRTALETRLTRPPAPSARSAGPASTAAPDTGGRGAVTVEPAGGAVERVQHLVRPVPATRHGRRPMRKQPPG